MGLEEVLGDALPNFHLFSFNTQKVLHILVDFAQP